MPRKRDGRSVSNAISNQHQQFLVAIVLIVVVPLFILFQILRPVITQCYFWLLHYVKDRINRQKHLEQQTKRLHQLFYEAIRKRKGRITLFEWATISQLPRNQAKVFLDQKAAEWDAAFEVSEGGTIIYQFPHH